MQIEYNEKYGDDNKSNNTYNSVSKELKSTQKKEMYCGWTIRKQCEMA